MLKGALSRGPSRQRAFPMTEFSWRTLGHCMRDDPMTFQSFSPPRARRASSGSSGRNASVTARCVDCTWSKPVLHTREPSRRRSTARLSSRMSSTGYRSDGFVHISESSRRPASVGHGRTSSGSTAAGIVHCERLYCVRLWYGRRAMAKCVSRR